MWYRYIILSAVLLVLVTAGPAAAQVWNRWGLSPGAPGYLDYLVTCNQPGRACTICEGLIVISNIVDFLTKLAYIIVGVMFVVGGFRYFFAGGSSQQLSAAKATIKGALVGLAIVLLAWVIVNTLLGILSGGSPTPWNVIRCSV